MPAPAHHSEVLASPWPGVHAAVVRSERHYGRHSHGTFGFGVVDAGAHRSSSGRGTVDAFAGQIVTTNPGEVHDGRPLGAPSRTWCTVYVEPALLDALAVPGTGDIAITQPVLVLQQRAEHARALIRRGASLAGAAADAGFADQPHMTRIFTRQFGFTPGAWQRAVRPQ